jgi:hypothetical protein
MNDKTYKKMTERDFDLIWEARAIADTCKIYELLQQAESTECQHKLSAMLAFLIRQKENEV